MESSGYVFKIIHDKDVVFVLVFKFPAQGGFIQNGRILHYADGTEIDFALAPWN
jgi:hypothetical protein